MTRYDKDTEELMILFFDNLREKDQRHYAAVEAKKLGHGGQQYISELFGISVRTIERGIEELEKKLVEPQRIRRPGGGRPNKEATTPELKEHLAEVVESHTAGCPVAGVRWTYLRSSELVEQLLNRGIQVSVHVIDRLLAQAGIGRRKLAKKETMKADIPGRDDQFKIIQGYKSSFLQNGYPVLSLDVKKKEMLGRFYRSGQVYGDQEITCYDHDFASFSTGKVVPYGVYDVGRNEGHMLLGQSADTAEFNLACLRQYWDHHGSKIYDGDHPILLLVDGGGSNGSTNRLFKQELQDWVDEIGRIVRVAHFPPYCSKYNPIEHRLFPFITRAWEGVMLDSLQTMIQLIESRTRNLKCGIKIFVEAMTRVFHAGVAVFDNYLESCNIIHDPVNGKWNYQVIPI